MLDTNFKRVIGDIGNPRSFDFPVIYQKVENAKVTKIVSSESVDDMLADFIEAAKALEEAGVTGITTSCGFLSVMQDQLAASVQVPLITSSLFLVPEICAELSFKPLAIVTADSRALTDHHLRSAKIPPDCDVSIIGMENCPAFKRSILSDNDPNAIEVDPMAVQDELSRLCQSHLDIHPKTAGFVFECTNLQPYALSVSQNCGVPVWGINDVIRKLDLGFSALT